VLSVAAVPFGGTGIASVDGPATEAYRTIEEVSQPVFDRGGDLAESTGVANGTPNDENPPSANASGSDETIDRAATERYVHQYINEERTERGLEPLDFDTELREVARYYSARMAKEDFFAHTAPDGESLGDRYDRFDYECQVEMGNGRIATGGENLAYTYYESPVRTESGVEVYGSERELAQGIVNGWMNSTGHRENLLRPYWENEGIGVYAIEENGGLRVYATEHFC
jgi:uncharacterized protein YkwD